MKKRFLVPLLIWPATMMVSQTLSAQSDPGIRIFIDILKAHPKTGSLELIRNSREIVSYHADMQLPLASSVKIILAVEYAEQVAKGKLDPDELIPEQELDRFYIPNTDGGAQTGWKKYLAERNLDNQRGIPMKEVVNGMIIFSSNANAEFLMDKLGIARINARARTLGIHQQTIYPFVSALFMANQFPGYSGEALLSRIRLLSQKSYIEKCQAIHLQLKNDSSGSFKKTIPNLTLDLQKIWSDRLPGSTARDYATLMNRVVNEHYFPPDVQKILSGILEWPMVLNPANKTVYRQLGMKGGSTAFILTLAAYAEDRQNNKTAFCLLLNDLTPTEQQDLQQNLNSFLIGVLSNRDFRNELLTQLK